MPARYYVYAQGSYACTVLWRKHTLFMCSGTAICAVSYASYNGNTTVSDTTMKLNHYIIRFHYAFTFISLRFIRILHTSTTHDMMVLEFLCNIYIEVHQLVSQSTNFC